VVVEQGARREEPAESQRERKCARAGGPRRGHRGEKGRGGGEDKRTMNKKRRRTRKRRRNAGLQRDALH